MDVDHQSEPALSSCWYARLALYPMCPMMLLQFIKACLLYGARCLCCVSANPVLLALLAGQCSFKERKGTDSCNRYFTTVGEYGMLVFRTPAAASCSNCCRLDPGGHSCTGGFVLDRVRVLHLQADVPKDGRQWCA